MDLAHFAAEVARNVGREFPEPLVPWQEMTLRQLSSMVEEAIELDEAVDGGDPAHIAEELHDATLTCYLVAHYADIDLETTLCVVAPAYEQPYRLAGKAMKAGRRFLGIARRKGTREQLGLALARVVLAVRAVAVAEGIDLEKAIADKLNVVFSRGWREGQTLCGDCHEPIVGTAWRHSRLGVYLHADRPCRTVNGEDVSNHCMERVELSPAVAEVAR